MNDSLDDPRRHVRSLEHRITDVASNNFPGHYPGEDHSWDLEKFKENLGLVVQRLSKTSVEFDLIGVDASIANAFRRIMMAEVPTMAIETVFVWNNTSIIQDEVLSHRLGLTPLKVNPKLFEYLTPDAGPTDHNTVVFSLNVKCERNPNAERGEIDPNKLYINSNVYSGQLVWVPQGEQELLFKDDDRPRPANDKILLAKLRPGQEIELEMHCTKGIGDTHAKWSPVATASYRLLPRIIFRQPIPPELVDKFQSCFPPGVIDVKINKKGQKEAVIGDMRKDTMTREVLRHHEFDGMIDLTRIRDYFLFSVESTGCIPPEKIFPESILVMRRKIQAMKKATEKLLEDDDEDGDIQMKSTAE